MKNDYSIIQFSTDYDHNQATLAGRDYHTICVIQDCFGTINPGTLAWLASNSETFPVNPAWPCGKGSSWYRQQSVALVNANVKR